MRGPAPVRLLAAGCLLVAAVAAVAIIAAGGPPYRVAARFPDAGQLVKGDLVEVGGRSVGKITAIRLTDNGMADVELTITDPDVAPLHEGTVATIRTVGLAAVANRFVDLAPGPPGAAKIARGGLLPPSQTRGIVDLDTLLNELKPEVRGDVQTLVHELAAANSGDGARQANDALAYLHPALSQTSALGSQLVRDQAALDRLVGSVATASRALAARQEDLGGGIDSTARALGGVARERRALASVVERSPATLAQARNTLARIQDTLPVVDPVLREVRPAVPQLERLLRSSVPAARDAAPAIADIRALLPQARAALGPLPELAQQATPALESATKALHDVLPMVGGLRPYGPDLIGGFFNGFGGATGGYYDANGHYVRISVQGNANSLPNLLPVPADVPGPITGGYRTGLTARCPGAAEEPAPDGSNPWVSDPAICDPKQNHR